LCFPVVTLLLVSGCRSLALPPGPAGVALKPGHYLREYYAAPDFQPARHRYDLAPFVLEASAGVDPAVFRLLFQTELAKAFAANGLALSAAEADCRVEAVVHRVAVSSVLRFLRGRSAAELQASGSIIQGTRPVFAFRDALRLTSPLAPGRTDPKETELLLRQLSRAFAQRLVNQLLLYGLAESG
jgi:hypothetical protein